MNKTVYTIAVMKTMKKFIVGGLVVALVSFAGGFCLHPMVVQAADTDMISHEMSGVSTDSSVSYASNDVSHTFNPCVFDCVSKTPQVVNAKKFSVNFSISHIVGNVVVEGSSSSDFNTGPTDFDGVHPPSPDILSSVIKKE